MFKIKNLSRRKKITITSIVAIVLATLTIIIAINTQSPDNEDVKESLAEVVDVDETKEKEEVEEEDTSEKPQEAVESTKNESETNNTAQAETKPTTSQNSSQSTSNSQASNSGNTGSSNSQTKPETSTPTPTPTPEPQPIKVTSLTTSTGNLTLEIGRSGNIVAKGAGTAYITAKSNENGNISVSILVTVNELGWYRAFSTSAYLADVENASADWWNCDVSSVTNGDMDVRINITNLSGAGVVSGVEQVILWMMPTQGQQVINKLYDASYNGGKLTNIDGRKVVISLNHTVL